MFSAEEILEEFCERANFSREIWVNRRPSSYEGYLWSKTLKLRARVADAVRAWRARPGNRERVNSYMKEWNARPEVKARKAAYNKLYWSNPVTRAIAQARKREWNARNPGRKHASRST